MKRTVMSITRLALLGMILGVAQAQDPSEEPSEDSSSDLSEVDLSGVDTSVNLNEDTPYGLADLRERYKNAAGDPLDNVAVGVNLYETARDLHDSYEALDGRCDVDLSAANTPRVPSSCAGSEACGACYEQAQRKLNKTRVTLERLRCIAVRTEAMKDDAMAVGESFASFPGMGLGWYAARRDIATGWQGFVNAYDAKYQQLLGSLETALLEIGRCEAQHFDEPDWYLRYGFIYHQFMEDSYHPRSVLN